MPPLNVGVEWFATDNISIGTYADYSASEFQSNTTDAAPGAEQTNKTYLFDLRVAFHNTQLDNLDIYGGFALGYQFSQIQTESEELKKARLKQGLEARNSSVLYTGFLGLRYAPKPKTSFFTEVGYGISIFQIGAGYRLL